MKTQKSQNLVRSVNESGIKILFGTLLLFSIGAAALGLYDTATTSAQSPDGPDAPSAAFTFTFTNTNTNDSGAGSLRQATINSYKTAKGEAPEYVERPVGGGIEAVTAGVISESCSPADGSVSAGERVTVTLGLKNSGGSVGNVIGTLAGSEIIYPSGPQSYGSIPADNSTVVYRQFSFMVNPEDFGFCGGSIFLSLQLQDGTTNLGSVSYRIPRGVPTGAPTVYTTGTIVTAIPDLGTVDIPITVPDSGSINDLNVRIRLNHTYTGDLAISLLRPGSNFAVPLVTRRGLSGDNFGAGANTCAGTPLVLDDQAALGIDQGTTPFAGTYRAESSLNGNFSFVNSGVWRLRIADQEGGDVGTVGCVTLEINRSAPSPISREMSFRHF